MIVNSLSTFFHVIKLAYLERVTKQKVFEVSSIILRRKKMSGIEQIAKSWLSDPPWQKVFKHTVDVVADYISYILVKLRFSEKATKI